MEVSLVFPLPYDGAIDQLTLMIDGKEVSAKLPPQKEAARYEEIVRKNRVIRRFWNGSVPGCFRPACSPFRREPSGA